MTLVSRVRRSAAFGGLIALGLSLCAEAEFLSVADFGAVPNDESDDLGAIQACIEAATEAGKACFVPAGEYVLAGDLWLESDAVLFGEGRQSVLTFPKGKLRALKNGSRHF